MRSPRQRMQWVPISVTAWPIVPSSAREASVQEMTIGGALAG